MRLVIAAWLVGCTVPKLELGDKTCPCADGYICVESTGRCVLNLSMSDACDGIPGALLCESFEDGIGAWTPAAGMPEVVTTRARDGTRSLHVTDQSFLIRPLADVPGAFYMRVFAYLRGDLRFAGLTALLSVDHMNESLSQSGASIGVQSEEPLLRVGTSLDSDSGDDLRTDEWLCLEAFVDRTAEEGTLYLDSQERISGSHNGWRLPVDEVVVGLHPIAGGAPRLEAWLDGVVIATEPIGCQ